MHRDEAHLTIRAKIAMVSEISSIRGVCVATLTPLHPSLQPDLDALLRWLRRLFDAGCDAVNLLGTTGEAVSLSVAQRLEIVRAVAASGLPLERMMVGTGAAAFSDAVHLTQAVTDLGFGGALAIPPFYYKEIDDGAVVAYYSALVERVDRPSLRLYLYHFPALSGVPFSLASIGALLERFPRTIAGIKDSAGQAGFAESLVAAFPALDVFPSSEVRLLDGRADGFAGCISASVNVTAPLAARLWAASPADRDALVLRQQVAAIRSALTGAGLIPALRSTVARLCRDDGWLTTLPPLLPLSPAQRRALDAQLDALPGFASITREMMEAEAR
jgi:4-hydroxy-tetrahydrodipicolinate synthase